MPSQLGREWWERARDRWLGWLSATRSRSRVVLLGAATAAVAVLLAAVFVDGFGRGLRVWGACVLMLLAWLALAPTKTVRWASVLRLFSVAAVWAGVVAVLTARLAGGVDLAITAPGPTIGIAAVMEETLKLAPLAVLGVLAPGRVRRFAATDWLLLGLACGMGFQAAEDFARRAIQRGPSLSDLLAQLQGTSTGTGYGWSLFGGGTTIEGVATYPGHAVETGLIAAGIGLAVRLAWRRPRRLWLWLWLWLLPLLLWLLAVCDHVGFNASALDQVAFPGGRTTVPDYLREAWTWTGHGAGRGWLLLGLLALAVLADARVQVPGAAGGAAGAVHRRWPERVGAWSATTVAAVASVIGGARRAAINGWRQAATQAPPVRLVWTIAALSVERRRRELGGPPMRPAPPWIMTRVVAAASGLLSTAVAAVAAAALASHIGSYLYASQPAWFSGLFDGIRDWWDGLNPAQKTLAAAAIIALVALGAIALAPEMAAAIAVEASGAIVVIAAGQNLPGQDTGTGSAAGSAAAGAAASPPGLDPDDRGSGRHRATDEELAAKGLRRSNVDRDQSAEKLADRLGGDPQVEFVDDPLHKEFDVVSERYIGEAKPANYRLGKQFRRQARNVFEMSLRKGRTPYFHFDGPPASDVIRVLQRYAAEYKINPVIDTVPFGG